MIQVRIGGVPEHFNFPWHVAIENGLFLEKNIQIEWSDFNTGTGAMCQELKNNNLEMALLLTEGAIKELAHSQYFKIVKIYVESPLIWGIHTALDSALNNVEDIKDKTYAISRYGSGSHLMAYVDARLRGWDTKELKFKTVNNLPGAIESFRQKETAVFFWEKFTTKPFVENGYFKYLGSRPTPWPCFVLVARTSFLQEHQEYVKTIAEIISAASRKVKADQSASTEQIARRYDLKVADVQEWFALTEWNYSLTIPEKDINLVAKTLHSLQLIPEIPKVTELICPFSTLQ